MVSNSTVISMVSPPDIGQGHRETYICLALQDATNGGRSSETRLIALDTETVQEVLVIPSHRLTVMPNMASPVMGLLNHRSRVIWVVDLPQLLGLAPLNPRSPERHLAILQAGGISLGLAIAEVKGIIRFSPEDIASPLEHHLPAEMTPYLQGCVRQEAATPTQRPLLILDAEAIAAYSA